MPVVICTWTDNLSPAKGHFVIDCLKSGLCAGGIRMRAGATLQEAQRLARTMTYKLAAMDIPYGGAKAAIDYDPMLPNSYEVLRRFLFMHYPFISEFWDTSEDLGTKAEDIERILLEVGIPSSHYAAISKADNSQKLLGHLAKAASLEVESLTMTDMVTGYGVAQAALAALEFINEKSSDCNFVVQGFGSVGGSAARYLAKAGCPVVAVADALGTIYFVDGLDVEDLLKRRDRSGVISRLGLPGKYEMLPRDEWLRIEADILVPAAVADVIREDNCGLIKARLIVEGANIPTTPEAETRLFERGILVIPDFVANAGAVGYICSILLGRITPEVEEALAYLQTQIRSTTRRSLVAGSKLQMTPRQAAMRLLDDSPTGLNDQH
jgi:glutamate dehydrogenase (NAD(P)+)